MRIAYVNGKADDCAGKLIHDDHHPMRLQVNRFTTEHVYGPQAVFHVANEGEPRGAASARRRFLILSENTPDRKTADFDAKALKYLHSDAAIAVIRVALFHLQHEINERL